jgi:hypothetical protein
MANGFSLGILQHIKEIALGATPQYKIELPGFTQSLVTAHTPGLIKNDSFDGHFKTVKVKKKQRYTTADTESTASCEITNVQGYTEDTVSVASYRQIAVHIEDEIIAAYDAAASAPVGLIGTQVPAEFMDELMNASNALLGAINADLVTLANSAVGVNRRTGDALASLINIGYDATKSPLNDGLTQILSDFRLNNMKGRPIVVGSGLFNSFMLQQAAKQAGLNGLDTRIQAAGVDFFYDNDVAAISGDNDIVVYEKDAVQLVQYLKYQGFKAGAKGTSIFGTVALPYTMTTASGGLSIVPINVDVQFKYNDCDADFVVDGEGATLKKGWNMILSSNFGLWTIPTGAYKASDPLVGNRGSLKYEVTNFCDVCPD